MIVYAEREERVNTAALLRQIEAVPDPAERLIRYGQWEAAVLDALCSHADDEVSLDHLPETVAIRPQEGFAYYALYPEQYAEAARRFAREQRPQACVVIGIRSIGTTLSTVVAQSIGCDAWRFTVRPRGHPFDRRLALSHRLQTRIRARAQDWFLIIDEGPGLSGSSFTSVAEALLALGIPEDRIVFFPSHEPDPAGFVSERARHRWPRHPKYVDRFDPARHVPQPARDLSGGQWRELLRCDVPVQPSHERRKYLHEGRLWKFAGLAHYGRSKYERGRELASFSTPVVALENGFLVTDWIDGTPAAPPPDVAARYLAHLARNYRTGNPVDYRALAQMIEVNTGLQMPSGMPLIEQQEAVAIDGRMLAQEWIRTPQGAWLKTDALDHNDDHFFPGCQDIAWDIAAACIELSENVLDHYPAEPYLGERVDFYKLAYSAFRIGYCSMAADALGGSEDARRFQAALTRYQVAAP